MIRTSHRGTDVVDIWYVAAATVGGEPINDPLPQAQAAGLEVISD